MADQCHVREYSMRRKPVRSNSKGCALIRDLPSGIVRITVRHGDSVLSTKLAVSEDADMNAEIVLRLRKNERDDESAAKH